MQKTGKPESFNSIVNIPTEVKTFCFSSYEGWWKSSESNNGGLRWCSWLLVMFQRNPLRGPRTSANHAGVRLSHATNQIIVWMEGAYSSPESPAASTTFLTTHSLIKLSSQKLIARDLQLLPTPT